MKLLKIYIVDKDINLIFHTMLNLQYFVSMQNVDNKTVIGYFTNDSINKVEYITLDRRFQGNCSVYDVSEKISQFLEDNSKTSVAIYQNIK